jgi:hypothetical protein
MNPATGPAYSSSTFSQAGYPVVAIESICEADGCSSTLNQTWFVTEGETNGEQRYLPILSTGYAYYLYIPYSCLLISYKFCNGGSGPSRVIKFLYAPAPPPPSVWALKPPSWALVHKTTDGPMIYTTLCIMVWMRAYTLLGQVGGGWAQEILSFLGPKWHSTIGSMPFHRAQKTLEFQGPKNSRIPGPDPLPLALVMDMHASTILCIGLYKSWVHK